MLITLDESLKIYDHYTKSSTVDVFAGEHTDRNCTDWKTNTYSQTLFPVKNNLDAEGIYHNNYLSYLELCWASHYGVVLTPDIVWYTLLCELASIVAEKPETYRSLFTSSAEKTKIVVDTDDPEVLPLDSISKALRDLVPDGFTDSFLLKFSTSTDRSIFAHQAAFADTVSPYYDYAMKMCGLRSVRVDGTLEDWNKIIGSWVDITCKLSELDNNINNNYFDRIDEILADITVFSSSDRQVSKNFFKDIFKAERCGSGSDVNITGWFSEFYRVQPKYNPRKVENFASHVSVVNYENLTTKKNFVMKNGLFQSRIVGETLEPEFGYMVYEKTETVFETKPKTVKMEFYDGKGNHTSKEILYTDFILEQKQ